MWSKRARERYCMMSYVALEEFWRELLKGELLYGVLVEHVNQRETSSLNLVSISPPKLHSAPMSDIAWVIGLYYDTTHL